MKIALITGASSGIGAEASRHLAQRGYKVILVARRRDELEKVARAIGANAVVEPCDLSSGDDVLAMAGRVKEQHGVPDVIVNSAGAGQWKYIEDTTPQEAVAMMQAPYFADFNICHAFMRDLLARRSGVIIHVNSPAGIFPWPSSVGYAAARAATTALHEALYQDLRGTGVQTCQFLIPKVASPYFETNKDVEDKIPGISRIIRTLTPDECGKQIADLAQSPKRQKYYPFLLWLFAWFHGWCPRLTMWLLAVTGYKRPASR